MVDIEQLLAERVFHATPRDTPFPIAMDPTRIRDFRSCPRKFYLAHMRGLTPQYGNSVHLIAGGAFAKGLEMARRAYWGRGVSWDQALRAGLRALWVEYGDFEPPPNSPKGPLDVALAFVDYFREYPPTADPITPVLRRDGTPSVEFTAVAPLPGTRHPETGDPFLATARYDMVGKFRDGVWGVDEKTTTRLGPSWVDQWTLRSQFIQYGWVTRESGQPLEGFVVRGTSLLKAGAPGHAQAILYHTPQLTEQWLFSVQRVVDRMIECWEQGYWDPAFDEACSAYSGCPFRPLCAAPEPEPWLADYEVRVWDPLNKEGREV